MTVKRDWIYYDTHMVELGTPAHFFGSAANPGWIYSTNVQTKTLEASRFDVHSCGVRLIGKTREQEDLLFDHLHFNLTFDGHSILAVIGPQVSILRHVFSKEELKRLEVETDTPPDPVTRLGYHFAVPVINHTHARIIASITALPTLPETVTARVYLFGMKHLYDPNDTP